LSAADSAVPSSDTQVDSHTLHHGRRDGVGKETDDFLTHRLPLDEAPHGYEVFQEKEDGAIKVVLEP
jgi:threonine dehydrogenase-like Zn-dependent dehydrogenase